MTLAQIIKSRTVKFNAVITAIVEIARALGYEVPIDVVTWIFGLGNIGFRLITKQPISEK